MAVVTPKSVIQLTTYPTFETGRKHYVHVHYFRNVHHFNRLFFSLKREVFPNLLSYKSHTKHRFIILMRTNQDQISDGEIDYKCYVINLLRFLNNLSTERIDKRFKEFCYIGLLKIFII